MQITSPTIGAVANTQPMYSPYTQNPAAVYSSSPVAPAFGRDQFVPTGYVPGDQYQNVVYGETKNLGLRILGKTLNLHIPYAEVALIDKTPENPMDIEEIDFNLKVKSGQMGITDVDATLTIEKMLREGAMESGKQSPVKDLRVVFDPNNQIRVEGKVTALGMQLPFQVKGQVHVDTAGQVRYDLGKTSVAGIAVGGLMKTFGMSLDSLLKLRNPHNGYYTEGNSIYVNIGQAIGQQNGAPELDARVRGVRTTPQGKLEFLIGETPEDAQRALDRSKESGPAYLNGYGNHAYVDGFFIKDGQVSIYDRTPGSPLNLNATGGMERNIQIHKGMLGITEPRFLELLKDEVGETDALTGLKTNLENGHAKVSGSLFGAIPISMHMKFAPTHDGRLMFSADHARVAGIIPVPTKLVGGQLKKLIKTGEPYGNGITLKMPGMDLGYVSQVYHQDGYIVMQSGR